MGLNYLEGRFVPLLKFLVNIVLRVPYFVSGAHKGILKSAMWMSSGARLAKF
jgi:hypothetical protein